MTIKPCLDDPTPIATVADDRGFLDDVWAGLGAARKSLPAKYFYDTAGSTDKTLKLYEGHYHDLLNDIGKEQVLDDIRGWLDARIVAS